MSRLLSGDRGDLLIWLTVRKAPFADFYNIPPSKHSDEPSAFSPPSEQYDLEQQPRNYSYLTQHQTHARLPRLCRFGSLPSVAV